MRSSRGPCTHTQNARNAQQETSLIGAIKVIYSSPCPSMAESGVRALTSLRAMSVQGQVECKFLTPLSLPEHNNCK